MRETPDWLDEESILGIRSNRFAPLGLVETEEGTNGEEAHFSSENAKTYDECKADQRQCGEKPVSFKEWGKGNQCGWKKWGREGERWRIRRIGNSGNVDTTDNQTMYMYSNVLMQQERQRERTLGGGRREVKNMKGGGNAGGRTGLGRGTKQGGRDFEVMGRGEGASSGLERRVSVGVDDPGQEGETGGEQERSDDADDAAAGADDAAAAADDADDLPLLLMMLTMLPLVLMMLMMLPLVLITLQLLLLLLLLLRQRRRRRRRGGEGRGEEQGTWERW
jgi:hypothetical protein